MSPAGVFTMYICFHLHEQPNSKNAQTNRDKITPNLPELSLSLVFSGHGSTLRGFRQRIYALSAERRPKKS